MKRLRPVPRFDLITSLSGKDFTTVPTYTYECKKCGHMQDMFHGINQKPRVKCEECGSACKKLMGMGSGLIFKGSGFYETDYKNKGGGKDRDGSDTAKSDSGKTDGGKSDSAKAESAKRESGSGESKSGSGTASDTKSSKGSETKAPAPSKSD